MPGSLGLSDFQDRHDVTDAKLLLPHQEPQNLQARLVGESLKKTGLAFHKYLYKRLNEYCQLPAGLFSHNNLRGKGLDGGKIFFWQSKMRKFPPHRKKLTDSLAPLSL